MAVGLGLSPFVVSEVVLMALGWGRPDLHEDPLLGFSDVRPLFVLNQQQTAYEIPKSRQTYFRPASFAAQKPSNEYRVFCLGGSTVQGSPYAVETSFTTWLELSLNAAQPERAWRVVNCGGVSYASYRLVPILEEVLKYAPDLVIVYTGHNEFLEDRTYANVKYRPHAVASLQRACTGWRTFVVAREAYLHLRGRSMSQRLERRDTLGAEVDAMLDYRNGLAEYHWDEDWRDDITVHYEFNLRRMVSLAAEAGVPLVLVNPVSNLRDCPPFKVEPRDDLSVDKAQRFEQFTSAARAYFASENRDLRRAADLFEQALAIDQRHAGVRYELAQCYDALGMIDQARQAYVLAKDHDVCPLRILESMHKAVLRVADETGTPLVDVRALFEQNSRDRIPGGDLLVDHVHPNIGGHQLIADALAQQLVDAGIVTPRDTWEEERRDRYESHMARLDDLYFAQGQERLRALRGWTQGRARLERSPRSRAVSRPDQAPGVDATTKTTVEVESPPN